MSELGKGLPLSKPKYSVDRKISDAEKLKKLKTLVAELWRRYTESGEEIPAFDEWWGGGSDKLYSLDYLHLEHIKTRGSAGELKYNIWNVQLLTPEAHAKKHDGGVKDYRPKGWLKYLDTMFVRAEKL